MGMDEETKHERFRRIASKRTNDVIDRIRILGNCANRSSYEYTEVEVNKIFSEIETQLKMTKLKFTGNRRRRFEL
jgi:hypothetical protein